jgi:hypothetical protein
MTEKKPTTKKNTVIKLKSPEPVFQEIHNNTYEVVSSRLRRFRFDHPTWPIITSIVSMEGSMVVLRAEIYNGDGKLYATGHAEENRTAGTINKTSALENGETSALGRALAIAAYDASGSIASADEVAQAIYVQNNPQPNTQAPSSQPVVRAVAPPATPMAATVVPGQVEGNYTITQLEQTAIKRKADGVEFEKYIIHTGEGMKLTTLSEKLYATATSALNQGVQVFAKHAPVNNYGECNLKWLEIPEVSAPPAPPVSDAVAQAPEDVPF